LIIDGKVEKAFLRHDAHGVAVTVFSHCWDNRAYQQLMERTPDMAYDEKIQFERLVELAVNSAAVTRACACAIASYAEWSRIPVSFPEAQMRVIATLAGDPYDEPTFVEFHPAGTNYWSKDAPIAVRHFPYNRCTVLQCTDCGRCCLKYVEAGGYYVEPRIRALAPELVVDQPL
jgi:hypothetical protein